MQRLSINVKASIIGPKAAVAGDQRPHYHGNESVGLW